MTEIEIQKALTEIRQLKARYCRLLDTRCWEEWGSVFSDDVVMDVSDDVKPGMGEPEIKGRDVIVDQVRRLVGQAITVHQVAEPEIALTGDATAKGVWPMLDVVIFPEGVPSPVPGRSVRGFGWYHEDYVKTSGGWKIAWLKLVRQHVDIV